MCSNPDFLSQSVQAASGPLDMKKAHSSLPRTRSIAPQIITNVQAIRRRAACGGQRGLENTRMRLGHSDFAGEDDALKMPKQIMPGENALQTAIKIRQHHQAKIASEVLQRRRDFRVNTPGGMNRVVNIEFVKERIDHRQVQWPIQGDSEGLRHQPLPPNAVIIL